MLGPTPTVDGRGIQAIMMLSSSVSFPWWWLVAGAGTGVFLFYRGFRLLQRKRLIEDTPASKIRSAAMGPVEVSGLAVGPYTIQAPITGMPCFCYRTLVWQWKQRGKNSSWEKVVDENLHVPFYLDDNTGQVLVDPAGAELDIHRDFHEEFSHSLFSSALEVPSNIVRFLGVHGVSDDKKIKIEEYCIKPKNSLFILGTLAENHGLEATPVASLTAPATGLGRPSAIPFPGFLAQTLGGRSTAQMNVGASMIFTRSSGAPPTASVAMTDSARQAQVADALRKAGITNPAAWAAAGVSPGVSATVVSTGGSAAAAAMAPEKFDLRPPVVLKKSPAHPVFLISWQSQREVVKALGWKSALMIWGGPLLTLFCAYFLAADLGWL